MFARFRERDPRSELSSDSVITDLGDNVEGVSASDEMSMTTGDFPREDCSGRAVVRIFVGIGRALRCKLAPGRVTVLFCDDAGPRENAGAEISSMLLSISKLLSARSMTTGARAFALT